MLDFFANLFSTAGFVPRWNCGAWTDSHALLHIISDIAIFGAYFAIPVVLTYFVFRRRDIPFLPVFWLFAIFILSCGIGHLIEATIFWHPWYRFSGLVKLITAIVSWGTVAALVPILPQALSLPGLALVNKQLEREVHDRKLAEERISTYSAELERSNRELDQFAYSASHDLKAPLHAVQNLADWIKEDGGDALPAVCQEHLALLRQRTARMERLLDDLLEYSRVGRVAHKPEKIDTESLVSDTVALLAPPASFTVEVGSLPDLTTYRAPLEQVFRNLIGNAVKHHHNGSGRIEVLAGSSNGKLEEFIVRDDGPGIDPKYHEQVFEMFHTLKPRDQVEGSGMGLALVKKIVENRGGTVKLESALGQGTTIRFTWPRSVEG